MKTYHALTLTLLFLLGTSACNIQKVRNSNIVEISKTHYNINSTFYDTSSQSKTNDLNDQIYKEFIKNQKSWKDLKKIMANHLMSAQELGIISCNELKRPPVDIELKQPFKAWRLKQENESWILNTFYKWKSYEINGKNLCIEMIEPQLGFLSEQETRVLLSAKNNHHFESLNLEPTTHYREINYSSSLEGDCDSVEAGVGEYYDGIIRNDCMEDKRFEVENIPKEVLKTYIAFNNSESSEVENFIKYLYGYINCQLWPTKGYSQDDKFQAIEYNIHYSRHEAPPICIKNIYNIVVNENKNIELYFNTKDLFDNAKTFNDFITRFESRTESKRIELIKNQVKILLIKLGLNKENKKYNYGIINQVLEDIESNNLRVLKGFGYKQIEPIKNPKDKIVLYIKFLYGDRHNYYAKYDIHKNLTIVKLKN